MLSGMQSLMQNWRDVNGGDDERSRPVVNKEPVVGHGPLVPETYLTC
jgi:hypothetical protein